MRTEWDQYFLNMLPLVAHKSKDPNTKIGSIVVGPDNEIRTTGFNDLPRKVLHYDWRYERPAKYKYIVHSEANAIANAARMGARLYNCRIYLPICPCLECFKLCVQAGINRVIVDAATHDDYMNRNPGRWMDDWPIVLAMSKETGVRLELI